jgi:hypothetical protein
MQTKWQVGDLAILIHGFLDLVPGEPVRICGLQNNDGWVMFRPLVYSGQYNCAGYWYTESIATKSMTKVEPDAD